MKSNNEKLKGLMVLTSILGVIGLILIFLSGILGTYLADIWLLYLQDGSAETSNYQLKERANTNNFLVTGGILFGVSLTTILFAYYKKLNIKEK